MTGRDHRPSVVQGLGDIEAQDVYAVYSRIGAAVRAGVHRRPDDVRLFTTAEAPAGLVEHLPGASDTNFAMHADRVSRAFGVGWSVVANSAQAFSSDLYRFARDVLVGMRDSMDGLPAGISDCFIVSGAYASGPTRIHKDTADVFLFVVEGVKTMLLWPYEALADLAPAEADPLHEYVALGIDPDAVDIEPVRLTGRPGDVLYWPASYWHCAESDGRPSLSLHIASHRVRDLAAVWAGAFARAGVGTQPSRWSTSEREFAGESLAFGLQAGRAATSAVQQWGLTRHSTANFEILPEFGDRTPPDWDASMIHLIAAQRAPISWAPDVHDPHQLIVAANGRSFRVPLSGTTSSMLATLSSLDAGSAVDLRPWRGTAGLPRDVAGVLDVAYTAGAIDFG